ncbi:hypothetical protein CRG98_022496 [Punica granatum]|uniref:Uncharacterized protein n=1 Tax=Punica granatum TaxID=22663 RepID=A0A2I0JLE7_PUNGR|nr:hypothetical protein CRG98_022496 [Punica granatum]
MSDVSEGEKSPRLRTNSSKKREVGDGSVTSIEVPPVYRLTSSDSTGAQEGSSIQDYYNKLKLLWDELEFFLEQLGCSCEAGAVMAVQRETERCFQFVMGLTSEFNTICSTILSILPMPNLNKNEWILDMGASKHMMGCLENFSRTVPIKGRAPVYIPNGGMNHTSRRMLGVDELQGGVYYLMQVATTLQICQAVVEESADL